ncbi:MAG: efflux RND transporter permease subunit [Pirellulales bacterium]|nr:efflux RND transporter permease subunit [Pirellulales bacterium]
MHISHRAIDRPRVVIVGVLMVIAIAILAALYIPVQRTPGINTAVILVTIPYPGAQPTEVEDEVTRKVEEALKKLDRVDFIASTSMRGSSVTQIIFLDGVDAKEARTDVAHLVDEVRALLPQGREVQPIITDIDFESAPIMLVNLSGPKGFDPRALKQIAEDVQDELEAISGVANTQQFGGREREIHVNVNPDLFMEYGFSIGEIFRAVSDFHSKLPGGSLNTEEFDYQVRNATKLRSVNDIRQAVVAERSGRLIRVRDVADVRDTYRRLKNVAQLDGQETATIVVNKEANINTLDTARQIKQRVAELQDEYPHIKFSTTRDISEDISIMFSVLGSSAVFGAMLVLIILAWSMGLRISILVLLAIPFSSAIALIFLFAASIPISNMVIFSFILVLGMVVDGAIIVAENIHRHIERGEPPIVAAKTGIDEVGIPVIAADLTTAAAFLPMLLVPGIMGDFMGVMPKVVSVALFGSMVVDHFLIPVLAAYWYRQPEPESGLAAEGGPEAPAPAAATGNGLVYAHPQSRVRPNHGALTRAYAAVLHYSLSNRWVVLCCCAMAIFWAVWKLEHIGFVFFPVSDRGQFEINYELPLGYSIEETLRASKNLTNPLLELKETGELIHFVNAVGSTAGLATRLETDPTSGPEFGKIMVQLAPPTERERHQKTILRELREKIDANPYPGLKYTIEELKEGPPGGSDVAVRLTGKNLEQLGRLAERIARRLEETPGTVEVSADYRPDSPELVVEPDKSAAGLFGLSDAEVAVAVQTAILGNSVIQLPLDDEDVTLRLQADPEYQKTKDDVERLMLTSRDGRRATVGQVARVHRGTGLYAVNRWDRRRAVTVRSDVRDDEGFIPDDIFAVLRKDILPEIGFGDVKENKMTLLGAPATEAEGVRATFTGENEERDENFGYLLRSMIVGVLLIFGILVVQFNSFRQTVVVLGAVPLSFVGVVFGMWICGHSFSLASFIGLICLAGIVVNDAIVLVDFTNQARRRGMRVKHALLEAGVNRLRPVILTTVTTIGGLAPLFLNISGGAEFWQPLTGAVIFGLAFATVLTLLVIPVCYSLAYSFADRKTHPE